MTPQPVAFSRRFIYVGVALLRFKYPIFGVTVLEVNHWVWDRRAQIKYLGNISLVLESEMPRSNHHSLKDPNEEAIKYN
jgi:hypothetical protein